MALPVSFLAEGTRDYSNEQSSFSVPVTTLTAGNFTAQAALHTALLAAIATISLAAVAKTEVVANRTVIGNPVTTNPLAQRENKWLLRYHGATLLKRFSVTIPGADLSLLSSSPQTDFMDTSLGAWTALKAAFEAVVVSPDDAAEAVILDSAQFVGRDL